MWRYLSEVLGDGAFETQRDRLAAKVAEVRFWLDDATGAAAQRAGPASTGGERS
jgi:hypothetical protein